MNDPEDPKYSFPKKEKDEIMQNIGLEFYIMIFIIFGILGLAILGYAVEMTTLGDKIYMKNSLVEAIDEDNPE